MSRVMGSGALSADIQLDLMRVIQARKEMTVAALARKHNVSKGVIKGVLYRLRRKARVKFHVEPNTPTGGDSRVAEEPGK